ncbi:hypothetical protein N7540_005169 [Penicillium herquei]|nr:hypothetical protein N7540_005169 [Penicillium herquei]
MESNKETQTVHQTLHNALNQDPGLPREEPSTSFWQLPPHKLTNVQSTELPQKVDITIIGSGITGCSVAHTLLTNTKLSTQRIALFEARSLTSGATGRNGGHLVSPAAWVFSDLEKTWGTEKAAEVARFTFRNLDRFYEVEQSLDQGLRDMGEVRKIQQVLNFLDITSFNQFKESFARFSVACPELAEKHKFLTGEEAKAVSVPPKKYKFKQCAAAVEQPAGALWPYRLITGLFTKLLSEYPAQFSIDTNTPITAVEYDESKGFYCLQIPRGLVYSEKVVYCTNAYTSHLLPLLRGKAFPLRGTMSTQSITPSLPNYGSRHSWSIFHEPKFDKDSGKVTLGLYYMTQNPKSGDFFLGGEQQRYDEIFSSDDTVVPAIPSENLTTIMADMFESPTDLPIQVKSSHVWSGIMGFTSDGMPLVGRLGKKWTGRSGEREWAAVGFNGYGMDKCWLVGETLGAMISGENVADRLPSLYQITDERLERMDSENPLENLFHIDGI